MIAATLWMIIFHLLWIADFTFITMLWAKVFVLYIFFIFLVFCKGFLCNHSYSEILVGLKGTEKILNQNLHWKIVKVLKQSKHVYTHLKYKLEI